MQNQILHTIQQSKISDNHDPGKHKHPPPSSLYMCKALNFIDKQERNRENRDKSRSDLHKTVEK